MRSWTRRAVALIAATTAAVMVTGWPPDTRVFDGSRRVGAGTELGAASFDAFGGMPTLPPSGQAAIVTPTAPSPGAEAPIAPPPVQFTGSPSRPAPPPAVLRQQSTTKAGGTWAVAIGINDYPGTNADLKSAVNDANDVVQALGGLGVPGDRILALRDGQATTANIRAAVGWLTARAGPDSVGVFFFAGHVRKGGPGGEAMVGADGSDIDDVELADRLENLEAREAWVGIAGCYGGGFVEVLKPGRVLTGAAAANEIAYENSGFGRSYMVEYMVRQAMVEKKASETVQVAFNWAREQIRKDYPNRVPVQYDYSDGTVDLRPPGQAKSSPPPRSGGSGGGGGSSPPPSTPPSTTPPRENCTETFGVTWCS